MKKIQPIKVWKDGAMIDATDLRLVIISDNLQDNCTFYYSISDSEENVLSEGNISLSGEKYLSWDGSNDQAYQFASEKLNINLDENA